MKKNLEIDVEDPYNEYWDFSAFSYKIKCSGCRKVILCSNPTGGMLCTECAPDED